MQVGKLSVIDVAEAGADQGEADGGAVFGEGGAVVEGAAVGGSEVDDGGVIGTGDGDGDGGAVGAENDVKSIGQLGTGGQRLNGGVIVIESVVPASDIISDAAVVGGAVVAAEVGGPGAAAESAAIGGCASSAVIDAAGFGDGASEVEGGDGEGASVEAAAVAGVDDAVVNGDRVAGADAADTVVYGEAGDFRCREFRPGQVDRVAAVEERAAIEAGTGDDDILDVVQFGISEAEKFARQGCGGDRLINKDGAADGDRGIVDFDVEGLGAAAIFIVSDDTEESLNSAIGDGGPAEEAIFNQFKVNSPASDGGAEEGEGSIADGGDIDGREAVVRQVKVIGGQDARTFDAGADQGVLNDEIGDGKSALEALEGDRGGFEGAGLDFEF